MTEDIGYQILLKKKKCLATKKMQKYIIFVTPPRKIVTKQTIIPELLSLIEIRTANSL